MSFEKEAKSDFIAYGLLMFVAVIWGGTWPLGRWIVTGPDTIPPLIIVILRYFFVVITFSVILKWKEKSFNWPLIQEHWKLLTLMGFLSVTVYQAGFLFGEKYTSASDASLVVATGPIWVILIAPILINEKITLQKLIGAIIGLFGVFIIIGFSPNIQVEDRLLGDFLVLIAAVVYACYSVLIRFFFNQFDADDKPSSLYLITIISIIGFFTTIPFGLIFSPEYLTPDLYFQVPIRIWIGIFYLAFLSTSLAYLAYMESINRLGASRAAIFVLFVPVFGVAFSSIFLQEIIDPVIHSISFLSIMIGVILINRDSKSISDSNAN